MGRRMRAGRRRLDRRRRLRRTGRLILSGSPIPSLVLCHACFDGWDGFPNPSSGRVRTPVPPINRERPMDVVFAVMPFADVGRPALGVSLLASELRVAGYRASVEYCNFALAEVIGPE